VLRGSGCLVSHFHHQIQGLLGEAPSNVNVRARPAISPGIVSTNEQNRGEREMADEVVTKFVIRPEIKWFAEVIFLVISLFFHV